MAKSLLQRTIAIGGESFSPSPALVSMLAAELLALINADPALAGGDWMMANIKIELGLTAHGEITGPLIGLKRGYGCEPTQTPFIDVTTIADDTPEGPETARQERADAAKIRRLARGQGIDATKDRNNGRWRFYSREPCRLLCSKCGMVDAEALVWLEYRDLPPVTAEEYDRVISQTVERVCGPVDR